MYKASYDAPLTRKTRLELPNMLLLLFFDVTGSKKMILGEMINFAKKVACIQFTFYGAFIQFTLTLYGPVKSPFLDLQNMMLLKNSWQSSFRFEKKTCIGVFVTKIMNKIILLKFYKKQL